MSDEVKKFYQQYYGDHYQKAMDNNRLGLIRVRNDFVKQYPDANLNKFKFEVELTKTGDIVKTDVLYKVDDNTSYSIASQTFQSLYADALYWTPKIWSARGTIQPLTLHEQDFDMSKFNIYVNEKERFLQEFDSLDTAWTGTAKDITKVKFDISDPYFASIAAAYITTYKCGVSLEHLKENKDTPKIITSVAKYHVYYHMRRFLRDPNKMSRYLTKDIKKMLKDNIPTKTIWVNAFASGKMRLSYWYNHLPDKTKVRNYRYEYSSHGGSLGIRYQKIDSVVNKSDTDYIQFLASTSNGLTPLGLKLFQQSIESYVYCVLAAQAKTRWAIVGGGAKSLQTQDIFRQLFKDTVAEDDVAKSISNMRKAIQDTHVVLNMAISPGLILIPSDMILLKEKIAGYNNVLTLATKDMKFGSNANMNYVRPTPSVTQKVVPLKVKKSVAPKNNTVLNSNTLSTFGVALGSAVIVKYLVSLI